MPELIRLQTPDFEFSVWANDISQRANVYNATLLRRANLTITNTDSGDEAASHLSKCLESSYVLRFSPSLELEKIHISQSIINEQNGIGQIDNAKPEVLVIDGEGNCIEQRLTSPYFFENTQYQFEWVFFGEVTNAFLTHRSQSVNESFRFSPEVKTPRGVIPARLIGAINTGNDVGWLRLPLTFVLDGKSHKQHISFEVLPTKMALHQDLPAMYQAIDKVYPLLRFSLVEKTEQDVATSQQRGHFPLMWLANFSTLRARFEQGLKVICAAPHSRLQPTVANVKAGKLKKRIPHKLAEHIKLDFANSRYDKSYRVEKKKLSVDTPENRFIKMVVNQSKSQLAEFEAKLRKSNQAPEHQRLSDSFLDELHSWQHPLQNVLTQNFLKEVGSFKSLSRESLVLQQKSGYSSVYRVWQELKFYLDVFSKQSSISMKSVSEIYEVWCFLCIKHILEQDLGFELVEHGAAKLAQNDFFEYQLKDGFAGAFRFKRADGVTARLAHEPKFTKKGQLIRSFLVNQEPDIVLEVILPKTTKSAEERQFIWIFDAKYRIKSNKDRYDDSNEDITVVDYAPDDAINQMHRYRDALILLSESHSLSIRTDPLVKKSRPVFGAFALYPGFFDQTSMPNPYASAIEEVGIGAFALLPSQTDRDCIGHQWLSEFLHAQIGSFSNMQLGQSNQLIYSVAGIAERLYAQEAARIPYSGMHQIFYPDLTMTVALGGQHKRNMTYFEKFEQGTAQWFHLPQSTFLTKFKQHIVEEIRYLALASISDTISTSKKICKLWPVNGVSLLPRSAITEEQAGKTSESEELYYLFELGKPLTLQNPVTNVPHHPIRNSMKLTTLTRLETVTRFSDVERVHEEAI